MNTRTIRASRTAVMEPTVQCMCGGRATSFMEVHAVDRCDDRATLNQFFCSKCLESYTGIAQEIADAGSEFCESCGLPLVNLCDIVVRICHFDKG